MRRGTRSALVAGVTLAVMAALAVPAVASVLGRQKPRGEIIVSAAASLTEAFTEIGKRFQKQHPGTDVTFNFDASSALVLQIQSGAPVDVFASADETNMHKVVDSGDVTAKPVVFAHNELEIATKPGNPEHIRSLADLAEVDTVALCAAEVPCGKYADAALAAAGVTIPADRITRGLDAKATLTAVAAGDADAAIVYVTDVRAAASSVRGIAIPDDVDQIATYQIAPVARATNPNTAKAFVKFVASSAGQKILRKYGFRAS